MFAIANPVLNPKTDPAITSTYISADPNILALIALVWIQVVFVTMVYGPIAAFLVEYFPARIRYTSLSIPYHIGNGWFGGFLPLIAASLFAATGNIYAGLIYPIVVALITAFIGWRFVRETQGRPDLGRGRRRDRERPEGEPRDRDLSPTRAGNGGSVRTEGRFGGPRSRVRPARDRPTRARLPFGPMRVPRHEPRP